MPALSDEYSRAIGETAVPLYKSSARSMARHVSLTKLSPRSDSTVCRPVMLSELTVHLQTRSDSPKRREVAGLFVTIWAAQQRKNDQAPKQALCHRKGSRRSEYKPLFDEPLRRGDCQPPTNGIIAE